MFKATEGESISQAAGLHPMDEFKYKHIDFQLESVFSWTPVQTEEHWNDMFTATCVAKQMGSCPVKAAHVFLSKVSFSGVCNFLSLLLLGLKFSMFVLRPRAHLSGKSELKIFIHFQGQIQPKKYTVLL